ncbi:MAG TPA: SAM-dependent methyltransferase [Gaiellaceae bacterium]|nr:SAM-dependent methyltransferase [Gaiellaceae bacterium]
MARKGRVRLLRLREELLRAHPSITDPDAAIARGAVVVNGRAVSNPSSLVREGAAIALRMNTPLRGEAKLRAGLAAFAVEVHGRAALDVGAAAGGFTRVLLDAGARRVYAVDAGHGQLLGSLRQDMRVVVLERVNLGELNAELVPEPVDVVTLDLSYLALTHAVPQLEAVRLAPDADAIALVKPQFELGLAAPPVDEARLLLSASRAADAFARCGWTVEGTIESPVRGRGGARELLVHARRVRSGRCSGPS